jgi:hypothetical protein
MDKTDGEKLMEMFKQISNLETRLREMDKEELINLLVTKFLIEYAPLEPNDKNEMDLWCYTDSETGLKYITNEFPKEYYVDSSEYPIFFGDGEVNLRIPDLMAPMFPDMKPDEPPKKIHLTVAF